MNVRAVGAMIAGGSMNMVQFVLCLEQMVWSCNAGSAGRHVHKLYMEEDRSRRRKRKSWSAWCTELGMTGSGEI